MPSVDSSRVKNTGRGEIGYNSNAAAVAGTPSGSNVPPVPNTISSVNGDNIGGGFGIFAGTNGVPDVMLEFKSLRAGNGITMSEDALTITINSTGSGGNGTSIADGFQLSLGNAVAAGDGLWTGAVELTDNTAVSDAVYKLNQMMSLLVPPMPPAFPNGVLSISNTSGNQPLLANAVANHASSGTVPGTPISRIIAPVLTNTLTNVGPGNSGTLQVLVNNNVVTSHTLTGTGDNGTYGSLVISNQLPYPQQQPGFWKSVNVGISGQSVALGVNKISINDTAAGKTNDVLFVYDDMTSTANITASSISQSSSGVLSYSSGVPHYGSGATLMLNASINNISGQTYYGGSDPLTIQGTNGITSSQTFSYPAMGITTPIRSEITGATAITPIQVNIDGSVHDSGFINGIVKNVNGSGSSTQLSNTIILVKYGSAPANKIDEMSVPVSGLGSIPNNNNAVRTLISNGVDNPTGAAQAWVSNQLLQTYEASVVAGSLSNDVNNYATGYLPSGPNYSSGRSAAQYATFSFGRNAVSNFKIHVTGTYAGCWIKLVGVSDNSSISPHAVNGWWNAGLAYNGAGVPGNISDLTNGCAVGNIMSGNSGIFNITFGPQTSSNATGNIILVRFRLNSSQRISALSFSN